MRFYRSKCVHIDSACLILSYTVCAHSVRRFALISRIENSFLFYYYCFSKVNYISFCYLLCTRACHFYKTLHFEYKFNNTEDVNSVF